MKRLIALLIVPAVALAPGTASATASPRRRSTRGRSQLVGADGDYVTGNFGKAQLVDNKRNDKLSVHVRRRRGEDDVHLQAAGGRLQGGRAPGGTDVAGFKYKPLRDQPQGRRQLDRALEDLQREAAA